MSEKEILALIKKAYFYGQLSIHGNAYTLPAGKEWELENERRVFLSDWDFLKKYGPRLGIPRKRFPARSDFNVHGMYEDVFSLTLTYQFETYDGGRVVWDFEGAEDGYGNSDILDETPQSRLLEKLMNEGKFDVEDLYHAVTGKRTY